MSDSPTPGKIDIPISISLDTTAADVELARLRQKVLNAVNQGRPDGGYAAPAPPR
jgi:hypothetical protein